MPGSWHRRRHGWTALKPGGRLVFPWRPAHDIGLAVLATRQPSGFALRILGGAWFIPCSGASDEAITVKQPSATRGQAGAVDRACSADRAPDSSAVAIYPDLWFSSHAPGKDEAG